VEAAAPYRLAWANPAWEALSGQDWGQVVGQPCLEVVRGPPANACRLEGLQAALVGHVRGRATLEYQVEAEAEAGTQVGA